MAGKILKHLTHTKQKSRNFGNEQRINKKLTILNRK